MLKRIVTAVIVAVLALAASAPVAQAQKALVYCPVGIDASGCDRIVTALQSKFTDGVDRGYDGSSNTVDLTKVDLHHYGVFVVPSLADDATKQPYALLRSVAQRLHFAITGRVAVYSGAPDQGNSNRGDKDALIQSLATWAANGHTRATGLVGLVAFLDVSEHAADRYSWVRQISLTDVSADQQLTAFSDVQPVSARGTSVLSTGGRAMRFLNMASYGLHIGRAAAARTEIGALGGTSGSQSVLVMYSNADGKDQAASGLAGTGQVGATGASLNITGVGATLASASTTSSTTSTASTSGPTITTDKADYLPGDTVTFTGTGFAAGDTVTITVHEDPTWSYPDRQYVSVADANGAFTNRGMIVQQLDLGVTFTATAVAVPSGLVAQTTFTDAAAPALTMTKTANGPFAESGTGSYTLQVANTGNAATSGTMTVVDTVGGSGTSLTSATGGTDWTCSTGNLTAGRKLLTCTNSQVLAKETANTPTPATPITVNVSISASQGTTVTNRAWVSGGGDAQAHSGSVDVVIAAPATFNLTVAGTGAGTGTVTSSPSGINCTLTAGTASGTCTFAFNSGSSVSLTATQSTNSPTAAGSTFAAWTGDATGTTTPVSVTMSANRSVTAQFKANQTITFAAPTGKTYGDADFDLGATASSGLTVSYSSSTTSVCTIVSGKLHIVAAGDCTVTASQAGDALNYNAAATVSQTFTIAKKSVSVASLSVNSKVYDGTTSATVTGGTLSGVVAGDEANVGLDVSTATATFTDKNVANGKTVTVTGLALSGTAAVNYVLGLNTATTTANITARSLTVTATGQNKVYDRTTTATVTLGDNRITNDVLTAAYTSAAFVDKNVGTAKTVNVTGISISGTDAGNYTANTTATTTANITARALVVSAAGQDKVYDGTTSATVTLSDDRISGDVFTDSYAAATFADKNVGTNKSVSVSGIGITGTDASNYSANTTGSTTANITAKALTVTASDQSKTYGDVVTFAGTEFTSSGLVNSETIGTVTLTSAGAAATASVAGSPYAITPSAATGGTFTPGNYAITYAAGHLTVNKKAASLSAVAASKVYGDADPSLGTTNAGFLAGDLGATKITFSASRVAGETVAGSPYLITPAATDNSSGLLNNYAVTISTANFTITPRAASVAANAADKTYGDADPTLTGTLTGFLTGDAVTATYTRTAGETVAGSPYTISATLAPAGVLANYTITYNTASFTIKKKAASVTPAATSKTYGAADPALTGTLSGFLLADNVTATYVRTAGETVLGGPYTISATLSPAAALANYSITYNTGTFTITAKAASVTPAVASKVYGAADPALTGTLTGFLAADNVTATYARAAGETVLGGPYTISASLSPAGVLSNYNVTYGTAQFTITPKAASVTPAAASKTYGDPDPTLSGTLSGFLAPDNVTATYSRTAGETVGGGPYTISAVLLPAGVLSNYTITYNTAVFTINKKAASVTPSAATKVYGAVDPALTGTLGGFLAADGVAATYTRAPGETVLGGPYAISATLSPAGVLGNYEITYNTAQFTITPKSASVMPNAASKTYGDADPALTGTLNGFLGADNVSATYARSVGETVLGGPYTISATLAPAGVLSNYTVTYNTASFTINPKAASVTPSVADKTYGDPDPAFSGTLGGFVAADGVSATYSRTAGETVAGSPYTISATLSPAGVLSNYTVTYNTANFTIKKKAASVTPAAGHKTYGAAEPALTGTLAGFLAADGVTSTYSRAPGETVLGGPYAITATLAPSGVLGNYEITYNPANFTIDPKTASVTPNAASKTYGGSDPAFTGTLSGFIGADGVTASYSRTSGESVAGSPYTISATLAPTGVLSNYSITYNTASFTINQKAASITASPASKNYGDADPIFTGSVSGFLSGDNVTVSFARTPSGDIPSANNNLSSASYSVVGTPNAAASVLANYAITNTPATFTITNDTPTITTLTGPPGPVALNSPVTVTGSFADHGVAGDQYTISSTWTDGSNSLTVPNVGAATYNTNAGTFSITAPSNTVAGVYTVTVTVTDRWNVASAPVKVTGYVVVYDPNGGFVTGGGWITAPDGSCDPIVAPAGVCTNATGGRANFGFVSKYQKGATVPSGNTEFQFQAGNLNFKSTVYQWLVISGPQAQYKGSGTINGSSTVYNFILTAVDGAVSGGLGTDKFRIKITDVTGTLVIFDNMMGQTDSTTPTTALGGGDITIHSK